MKTYVLWRNFLAALMLLGATLIAGEALAQEAPDAMLKRVSQEILETIKSDKELQKGNTRRVQEVVESKVLPYVDFEKTTALAVGRHWRDATPEQRRQLIDEFHRLLIYTYSGALTKVRDQKLVFRPLRADPADTEIEVYSHVVQAGREPIQLNYRLEKKPDGWKVYDINVLGAWMTETYKNTFAAEVNRSGIDGLIRTLAEKNRQLADSKAKVQ